MAGESFIFFLGSLTELSSQCILRNDGDMPVIQQQGLNLKEHFDRIHARFIVKTVLSAWRA